MRAIAWFCWLLCSLGGLAPAFAQAPVQCRNCRDQGTVPCGKHGKLLAQELPEKGVIACSVAAECKVCSGAILIDCKQCSKPSGESDALARQQLVRDWLVQRRKTIDALTAREPYFHLQTTHYDLAFNLKAATIGKEKVEPHPRMHIYGERLEALRALFVQTFELTDADVPDRMLVCMSEEAKDHGVLGPRLTGMGTANSVGLKLMGPEFVYSMWPERRTLPDDEAVHRNIVHNVTHLLLSQMRPMLFLGNKKHGWLDEGIPHWFEDKIVGRCLNFCFEEILLQPGMNFHGGKWRPAVRKLVDEGKALSFAALSQRNTDELTFVEHAFAFAYVDFLLATQGGAKFRDFLRAIKREQPTRDALPAAFGFTPLSIDAAFVQWVKATYSPLAK